MTEIRNYTPHDLTLRHDGREVTYPRSGAPAPRVSETTQPAGRLEGWPVQQVGLGDPIDLPEPEDGVVFVVSMITCQAAPGRRDLYYPYPLVRDSSGRIVGAAGLAQVANPS